MGQLRNALRAYLLEGYGPAPTLSASTACSTRSAAGSRRSACWWSTRRSGALVYANAGHPPPLVVGPDGATHWLDAGLAPPIGAAATSPTARHSTRSPWGRARALHRRPGGAPQRADRRGPRTARRRRLRQPRGTHGTLAEPAGRRDPRQRAPGRRRRAGALAAQRARGRAAGAAPARGARPRSARCASGCAAGWTSEGLGRSRDRRRAAGCRTRPPPTRSSTRSSRLPPRSSSPWRAWRGTESHGLDPRPRPLGRAAVGAPPRARDAHHAGDHRRAGGRAHARRARP